MYTYGIKDVVRRFATDTYCPICLIDVHDKSRSFNHLQYGSMVCGSNLLFGCDPLLSEEGADELDRTPSPSYRAMEAWVVSCHVAVAPARRIPGPFCIINNNPRSHSNRNVLGIGRNYNM